ncbi:MAG: hypothetical protein WBN03_07500, partial [Desulfobacterales bacterium]
GPVLELVGGEFQPSFETVYPGGDAYLIYGFDSIFVQIPQRFAVFLLENRIFHDGPIHTD